MPMLPTATTSDQAQPCLLCRAGGLVVAIPTAATVRVDDPLIEPPFPACAPWLGGFALAGEGGVLITLRLAAGAPRTGAGPGRGVLLDCGPALHCLIEIDAVLRLAEVAVTDGPPPPAPVPPGWLVAGATVAGGRVGLVVPSAIGRDLSDARSGTTA